MGPADNTQHTAQKPVPHTCEAQHSVPKGPGVALSPLPLRPRPRREEGTSDPNAAHLHFLITPVVGEELEMFLL